jgi:hypothetical protein
VILDELNRSAECREKGFTGINLDREPPFFPTFILGKDYNNQTLELLYDADARIPVTISITVLSPERTTHKMHLSFTILTRFGELLDSSHLPLPRSHFFIFIRTIYGKSENAQLPSDDGFADVDFPDAEYEIQIDVPHIAASLTRLGLLLDASGMMGSVIAQQSPRGKFDIARQLAPDFASFSKCQLAAFPGQNKAALVFHHSVDELNKVSVGGCCRLLEAVREMAQEMNDCPGMKRLIVFTDGMDSVNVNEYSAAVKALTNNNVALDVIALCRTPIPSLFPIP